MGVATGAGNYVDDVSVGASESLFDIKGFLWCIDLFSSLCVGSGFAAGVLAGFGASPRVFAGRGDAGCCG